MQKVASRLPFCARYAHWRTPVVLHALNPLGDIEPAVPSRPDVDTKAPGRRVCNGLGIDLR